MKTDGNETSFLKSRAAKELAAGLIAIGLFGIVILALMGPARTRADRASCLNNLKQVGLGLRMWSNDSSDNLPPQVSTNSGGTKEWMGSKDVYRHFLAASNEISDPKVLICPQDTKRAAVTNFADLRNQNLSYWVELNARETLPICLFIGDRHLETNGMALANGCYMIANRKVLGWGKAPHMNFGNVGLTDGSVHQISVANLASLRLKQDLATNWLAIP